MKLSEYQKLAAKTDHMESDAGGGLVVPLLGLAGETGSLLTEYKKVLRDKQAFGRIVVQQ